MLETAGQPAGVPRIEQLRVLNYRALRDVELKGITPLTVFLGPVSGARGTDGDASRSCSRAGLRDRSSWS